MPCQQCPVNTYNPTPNSKTQLNCQACPSGATTLDVGSTKLSDCRCQQQYYSALPQNALKFTCEVCPAGGMCLDFTCGLRMSTGKRSGCAKGSIVGEWKRDPVDDTWALLFCPTGHILQNATQDLQKCHKCIQGSYIANSKNPFAFDGILAACTKCPKSALCAGGGPPLFDYRTVRSLVYIIHTCINISFLSYLSLSPSLSSMCVSLSLGALDIAATSVEVNIYVCMYICVELSKRRRENERVWSCIGDTGICRCMNRRERHICMLMHCVMADHTMRKRTHILSLSLVFSLSLSHAHTPTHTLTQSWSCRSFRPV